MLRCVLLLVPGAIIPQLHDQHFRGVVSSGIPFPIRKTVQTATSTLRICYKLQRKIKSSHEIHGFFFLGAERQTPPREYENGESSGFDAPTCRMGKKTSVLCICNLDFYRCRIDTQGAGVFVPGQFMYGPGAGVLAMTDHCATDPGLLCQLLLGQQKVQTRFFWFVCVHGY